MKNSFVLFAALFSLSAAHAADQPAKAAPKAAAKKLMLESKGEENVFKQTQLTVKAGAPFELTLKNNSSSMSHNFVVVKPGKEQAVGTASMSAGEAKDWVAESPDVLFHSKLVKPKSSQTFTFTAPAEKGKYPFICTFPGHYLTMKGVLTVN